MYFLVCSSVLMYFLGNRFLILFLLAVSGIFFFNWKRREIIIYYLFISFIVIYRLILGNFPVIILASTPVPSPPTVVDSPDPQQGGGTITFSCSPTACQPGAYDELIKLLICKNNSASCVLGSQWSYRRPITISNTQNSNTLTDYQVLVTNPIYNETGLIASWHFNEGSGTIAFDSSGYNNNGNLVNGPTWVNGKFGKALSFDGSNDYVSTANQFSNPQTFSIVVWFKTTSKSGRKIIGFENAQTGTRSTSYDRHLYVGTDGKLYFGVHDGSTRTISTTTTVTDGNWHFAVATFSSNVMRLYLDGNFVNSSSTGSAQNYNGWWRIGSYKCAGWPNCGDGYFPGIIDEVRIYNRALSASEIQALYQAKARLDYGDIRFTDSDGTQLNYWQEADGKFWVKVPFIRARSTKTIYLYYGNPNATSVSNGDNTFIFFDDFSTTDTNKWPTRDTHLRVSNGLLVGSSTVTESGLWYWISKSLSYGNFSIEVLQRTPNANGAEGTVLRAETSGGGYYTFNSEDSQRAFRLYRGTTQLASLTSQPTATDWQILRFNFNGTMLEGYRGNSLKVSASDSTYKSFTLFRLGHLDGSTAYSATTYIDWVRIRKYTSPEPTTSIGNEETNIASNYLWNQSSAVASNPTATYTCPSCTSATNTYYGVTYSVDEAVWTNFTQALSFTCKKESSCPCTNHRECFNYCSNWIYKDGTCYEGRCWNAHEGSQYGAQQSCINGILLENNQNYNRYLNVNGELYYCKGSDNSDSPYPFVENVSSNNKVGFCTCLSDGNWSCTRPKVKIRII
ncbi:MAG: DUF2341 domain-containing protein [Candidatus Aenigmatarchaeota archaeon]